MKRREFKLMGGASPAAASAHRASQYVFDKTAKNPLNARLNPAGGRLWFIAAFGGVPFPILGAGL